MFLFLYLRIPILFSSVMFFRFHTYLDFIRWIKVLHSNQEDSITGDKDKIYKPY